MKTHSLFKKFMTIDVGLSMAGAWALSTTGVRADDNQLPSDLLISETEVPLTYDEIVNAGNTQSDSVYAVQNTDKTFSVIGKYDVRPIKNNDVLQLSDDFLGVIAVSDVQSTFTATLTLPTGLSFTDGVSINSAGLHGNVIGSNGKYTYSPTIIGKTLTVVMTLQGTQDMHTALDVKNAIKSVEDYFYSFVDGVKFDSDYHDDGTPLKMTG